MGSTNKIVFAWLMVCMESNGQAAIRLKCQETSQSSTQSIFFTASAKSIYFDIGEEQIAADVAKQLHVEFPQNFIGVRLTHYDIPCSIHSDYSTFAEYTCESNTTDWSSNSLLRDREGLTYDILWHLTKAYLHVTYDRKSGLSIESKISDPDNSFRIEKNFANKYRCDVSGGPY